MSGKPPFSGLRDAAILLRIIGYSIPTPEEHPGLSDHLWSLLRRCWAKNPSARPAIRGILLEVRLRERSFPTWMLSYIIYFHS